MGPILRNIARYGLGTALGWLAARGVLSHELADMLATDPEVQLAVQGGAIATGAAIVESIYAIAKKRGWAT